MRFLLFCSISYLLLLFIYSWHGLKDWIGHLFSEPFLFGGISRFSLLVRRISLTQIDLLEYFTKQFIRKKRKDIER